MLKTFLRRFWIYISGQKLLLFFHIIVFCVKDFLKTFLGIHFGFLPAGLIWLHYEPNLSMAIFLENLACPRKILVTHLCRKNKAKMIIISKENLLQHRWNIRMFYSSIHFPTCSSELKFELYLTESDELYLTEI